jgi:hypothetical protein
MTVRVTTHFSRRGLAILVCVSAFAAPTLRAQQPTPAPQPKPAQQPKEHVVKKGDTLWDLARFYLNDPFRWPMIYEANRKVIENPHWIFPLEHLVIVIPGLPKRDTLLGVPYGEPVVVTASTEPVLPNRSRFYAAPAAPRAATVLTSEQQRDAIIRPQEWMAAPWLADTARMGINGHVIASVDPRTQEDKLAQTFHPRDELYVSARGNVGDRLLALRLTRDIDGFGWVIEPMGVLRIDSVGAQAARAMIIQQFSDLKVGDLTMPLPAVPQIATVEPRRVNGGASGRIIDFLRPQEIYGTTDIVFIDMGSAKGLQVGDEVAAYLPERKADKDEGYTLPDEGVALMRVIKLTNNTATLRITRMYHSALSNELPVRVSKQQSQ